MFDVVDVFAVFFGNRLRLLLKFQIEIIIRIIPINRNAVFHHFHLKNEVSPPTPRSPGAVPSAKSPSIIAPVMALPDCIAASCIAKVNPQGRKNVSAPVMKVERVGFFE
jgi:hypothetical protein